MKNRQEKASSFLLPVCGLFTKSQGAKLISEGNRNIHSSLFGARDPLAKLTMTFLRSAADVGSYPWERCDVIAGGKLFASSGRYEFFTEILERCGVQRRGAKERALTVFEELSTNAFYHGQVDATGKEIYDRRNAVTLSGKNPLIIQAARSSLGTFLSVQDFGGRMTFDHLVSAFGRCYAKGADQIEGKDSGAGLGLYMVYEIATHLKIVVHPTKSTEISVWVADQGSQEPNTFSFNYFEKE